MKRYFYISGVAILTAAILFLSGCESEAQANLTQSKARSETETSESEEDVAAREEAERLRAEEEAKEKEEAEVRAAQARQAAIREGTYYVVKGGATLYASGDDFLSQPTSELPEKAAVYVDSFFESDGQLDSSGMDAAGDSNEMENGDPAPTPTRYARIKVNYDAVKLLGIVRADTLAKDYRSFISRPYEDVNYEAFEKTAGYETNPKIDAKALYISGKNALGEKLDAALDLLDTTELNSLVIDVKDDNGYMLFYSTAAEQNNPEANEHVYISDIDAFMSKMKEHNVYLIARIVTFKSPIYARAHQDRAIVYSGTGNLYSDADKLLWASAYDRDLWTYNVEIAKEAAALGFDEIQFDYVRFPAIANPSQMDYRNEAGETPTAAIQGFLEYAYESLAPYEVYVAADVFGWAATATGDVGIGQQWEALTNVVDYICPMVYPSHYGPGNFGLSVPDAYPYETVDRASKDAILRNGNVITPAAIRPWIQSFTASWVKGHIRYGPEEIRAQIEALEANGIETYLLWNSSNNYFEDAFKAAPSDAE